MKLDQNKKSILYALIAVAIMAVISLAFFPDAMEGKVLQQHDMTQGLANGQEVTQYEAETGHKSYWTNSLFSGMPTFQISPSYESAPMLNWITSVYSLGLPSPANLLFIMMLGFFIMGLCMKMRKDIALFGAIAWGFSTYFIIIIGAGHIWKFVTLAYIPPTIGGIILCYRGKYIAGTALTALFGAMQLLSNHVQMTYYFLFVVAAIAIGFLIKAIRDKKLEQYGIATALLAGAAFLAFTANSASLLNTAQYTKETIRGIASDIVDPQAPKATEGADFDYITAWSYGGDEMFSLMIPNVKGGASLKPEKGENVGKYIALDKDYSLKTEGEIGKLDPETAQNAFYEINQQTGLAFTEYFGNQPMTNGPVYVGIFLFYLAIVGCFVWKGPIKWCIVAVTILSMLLALGHNLEFFSRLFIDYFPFYNKFRTVSSILVITEFTLPVLAMLALAKIVREEDFLKKYKNPLQWTAAVLGLICLLLIAFPSIFGDGFSVNEREILSQTELYFDPATSAMLNAISADRLELVRTDALRSLFFLCLGVALLWLYGKKKIPNATIFMGAATLMLLLDLFSVNKRYMDSESFTEPLTTEEVMQASAVDSEVLKDTTANYRVANILNLGDATTSYWHKSIGGYHAAKLTRYDDLLKYLITPSQSALMSALQENPDLLAPLPQSDVQAPQAFALTQDTGGVFNMLNTKYFLIKSDNQDSYILNPYANGNAWYIEKLEVVKDANEEMTMLGSIDNKHVAVTTKAFADKLGKATTKAPSDTIYQTSYAPDRLTYHAKSQKGGIAVFSEVYFPWGWKATIDGKPIEISRVDYLLRAIRVPAGSHTIEFSFNPETLKATNTASVIAVYLIYILCLFTLATAVISLFPELSPKKGKVNESKTDSNTDTKSLDKE